jgi:hypothetical protein
MTQEHPIIPPPELIEQWVDILIQGSIKAFTTAAQWGADQELEACCEWLGQKVLLQHQSDVVPALRAARRPKPQSLKEQALQALEALQQRTTDPNIIEPLRLALEQLSN